MRAVLVDDEPIARLSLKTLLAQAAPDFALAGEAATMAEANALIQREHPDVVFLDIHLPDGNGIDLVEQIPTSAHVVFVSVSNDYAFRAFEVNALDYLQKPVVPERLAETVRRIRLREPAVSKPGSSMSADDLVYLAHEGGQLFVRASEILLIESQRNYTRVFTDDKRKFVIRRSIASWDTLLSTAGFLRISRTRMLRLSAILRVEETVTGGLKVILKNWALPLAASRRQGRDLRRRLKEIEPAAAPPRPGRGN